jgi:stalled ribosome rescue protein Dom34
MLKKRKRPKVVIVAVEEGDADIGFLCATTELRLFTYPAVLRKRRRASE